MNRVDTIRRVTKAEALNRIPQGERSQEVFRHGSLQVKVYAPVGSDPQSPHTRDEVYVVMRGTGTFVSDGSRQVFGPGDFLFAPAGISHRVEDFSHDFTVWAFFYSPEIGEGAA